MPVHERTRSLACNWKNARKQVTTGTPQQSGIPCAMVYGLWRTLPGVPGSIAPVTSRNVSAKLDLSVGRSGPHAFARPLVASLVSRRRPRPSHSAPRFVTIGRNVPLDEAGWATTNHSF
jgi:hypothetical protein